jgi:hypothetical protein
MKLNLTWGRIVCGNRLLERSEKGMGAANGTSRSQHELKSRDGRTILRCQLVSLAQAMFLFANFAEGGRFGIVDLVEYGFYAVDIGIKDCGFCNGQ